MITPHRTPAVPPEAACLLPFVAVGLLSEADVQTAALVARHVPGAGDEAVLAAALCVRALRLGNVCVVLDQVASSVDLAASAESLGRTTAAGVGGGIGLVDRDAGGTGGGTRMRDGELDMTELATTALESLPWPDPTHWAAALAASPAVTVRHAGSNGQVHGSGPAAGGPGPVGARTPLVFDGRRVYLERYWRYERRIGDRLLAMAGQTLDAPDGPVADEALTRYFGPDQAGNDADAAAGIEAGAEASSETDSADLQRRAAQVALQRRLTVLVGGPGTGKTYTVARLLAGALEVAAARGRPLDVALCAPTGKAAARMTEAVHQAVDQAVVGAGMPDHVAAPLLAVEAQTLHRLLGYRDGIRFRHDAADPLPHDLVVVDETSMVDLPMMGKLLDALRPTAQLVLVGDPFQLASVEAGAVLSDIVGPAARQTELPQGPLSDSIVVLRHARRFGADSSIAALADAVRAGDAVGALQVLRDPTAVEVALVDPDDPEAVEQLRSQVVSCAVEAVRLARAGDAAGALAAAHRLKVLCGSRYGPVGSHGWTREIERRLSRSVRGLRPDQHWYRGRPVMVTRNDYVTGVFNGDVGIVSDHDDITAVAVMSAAAESGFRWIPTSQLESLETWWAMTIHKSQGSEFDHAVVSLPAASSRALTNELLYTGITRGREQVTVLGSEASLVAAIERPVVRASGLQSRLWH